MPDGDIQPSQYVERPRILAIDGGGLKGAMPAALLAALEETTGKRVVEHFDLIAGTSTGGIIALGLALGLTAKEILSFYEERGPSVFGQKPEAPVGLVQRFRRWVGGTARKGRQAVKSKYDPTPLGDALRDVLGDARLGEARTRLVIPAYDSVRRTVYLYKTAHHDRLKSDYRQKAVDVAMATAAAPTFFPAHDSDHATGLRDGGVWANDPAGIAAIEGHAMLGWDMRKARILSLGCSSEFMVYDADAGYFGSGLPGMDVIRLLMEGQAKGAQAVAKLMLGHPHVDAESLVRVDVDVPKGWAEMDDAGRIGQLVGVGRSLAREFGPQVERLFLNPGPVTPFTPVHTLAKEPA